MLVSPIRRFFSGQCPEFSTFILSLDLSLRGQAGASASGWSSYADNFTGINLLVESLAICSKMNSALGALPIGSPTDGETERYRLVWAGQTVSVISPSFLFSARYESALQPMIQKATLRLQLPGLCVLFFAAFLFALIRYSYRAKELLACWLIFCSLLAALVLISLGIVLVCFAGRLLLKRLSVVKTVIPELVLALV